MAKLIEPSKLAKNKAKLQGTVNTNELPRLASELAGQSEVTYSLNFDYDEHGLCVIAGQISVTLGLTCYRCLNSCQESLELNLKLTPIISLDKSKDIPDIYEPILMDEQGLDLLYALEEEILLGLPLVPKHLPNDPNCLQGTLLITDQVAEASLQMKSNPFKELKSLKESN
jgi:uncharacterized protein